MTPAARARVAELKRVYAEGQAATVGEANLYHGRIVEAAMWRAGYRRRLDAMMAESPAMQAYLRRRLGE